MDNTKKDDRNKIKGMKVFSEKIGEIEIKDIINTFYSNNPEILLTENEKLFINYQSQKAKDLGFSKDLCQKLYGLKGYSSINIKYNEEDIPDFYKIIEIEDSNGEKEIHHIYRYKYCQELITKKKQFNNPLIIDEQKILKFSDLENIFSGTLEKFKIIDKEKINYDTIFSNILKVNLNEITGLSYSENFNHYFKYPNKSEKFIYNYSPNRSKLINMGKTGKIRGICGNFGIGKSTSLLASKLQYTEIIYFNMKALMKNKNNIFIWKYELILREIAFSFKYTSNIQIFNELKEKIEDKSLIWDSIIITVEFIIEKKIKSKIILDQYKELYDKNNENIKKIIDLINKDNSNSVKLIISSSINNKDIRHSLLKTWFHNYNIKILHLFSYNYFYNLFDAKSIIDNDKSLSKDKRKYINDFFNNIPKFYYEIKNIRDNELEAYKQAQKEKIIYKIEKFYQEDIDVKLSFDDYQLILNFRQKFGKILGNDDLFKILQKLPLKYFTLNNNIINFYFSLVETAFDEYFESKICSFLRGPINKFNDGMIGDMLEYILINDLKNNKFDKFDSVIQVETIWDLKLNENININNIQDKDILLIQTESGAKYLDFGILSKSNILILFQCKKTLSKEPEDYITKTIINENKKIIFNLFKSKFNINIKKIYLLYVTGISFVFDDKIRDYKLQPWGNKESETFKINEKICNAGQSTLIYYNPLEKRFYLKIDENEINQIKSLINFAKTLIEVNINDDLYDLKNFNDHIKYEKLLNQYFIDSSNIYLSKIKQIRKKQVKNEEFFVPSDLYLINNNKIPINPETFAILDNPELEDLFSYNICIGFKRKGSKIFTYEEKGKKRKYYEIKNFSLKEKTSITSLLTKDNFDKFYYMLLKNQDK